MLRDAGAEGKPTDPLGNQSGQETSRVWRRQLVLPKFAWAVLKLKFVGEGN